MQISSDKAALPAPPALAALPALPALPAFTHAALSIVLALTMLTATVALAADKPAATTAPARSASGVRRNGGDAIEVAIRDIATEYQTRISTPGNTLRTTSDYFKDNPQPLITEDNVLHALEQQISPDVHAACYVKWQLLSAIPDKVSDKNLGWLISIYNHAPTPAFRPGAEGHERWNLELMIRNKKESDIGVLTNQFQQMINDEEANNKLILTYRDGLFHKLPPSADAIGAGFEDAKVRLNACLDAQTLVSSLVDATRSWASNGNASPQQLKAMSDYIRQTALIKTSPYYDHIAWNDKKLLLEWKWKKDDLNYKKSLDKLVDDLMELANNPTDTSAVESSPKKSSHSKKKN